MLGLGAGAALVGPAAGVGQGAAVGATGLLGVIAAGALGKDAGGAIGELLQPQDTNIQKRAAAAVNDTILSAFREASRQRTSMHGRYVRGVLTAAFPEYDNTELMDNLVRQEVGYEREFSRKKMERLERDIPATLEIQDPARRNERMREVLRRERLYDDMRQAASANRAHARLELEHLQVLSPRGAFWRLSPNVREHTLDCLAMANRFWPWDVLEKIHPPLHHGCPCKLLGEDEAREEGHDFEIPESKAAAQRALEAYVRAKKLMHAAPQESQDVANLLIEAEFRDRLHPRNRLGQFRMSGFHGTNARAARSIRRDGLKLDPDTDRIWVTSSEREAKSYATERAHGDVVVPVDVELKKPFIFDRSKDQPETYFKDRLRAAGVDPEEVFWGDALKQQGYDGIVYFQHDLAGRKITNVEVFSPESVNVPVDVGSDVQRAAELLGQGKRVQLDQPREVSTLLGELAKRVREAKAAGTKAPNFDLCKVSVKDTNLFCAQSKGIPRVKMPQLAGIPTPGTKADKLSKNSAGFVDLGEQFKAHLAAKGVKIDNGDEQAEYLRATQSELNGAKVAGILKSIESGKRMPGDDDRLFVSRDNYIVDGHHRWAAKVTFDLEDNKPGDITMPVARIDMGIIELLDEANRFADEWGIPQQGVAQGKARIAEADFTERLHPRDRRGRFARKPFAGLDRVLGLAEPPPRPRHEQQAPLGPVTKPPERSPEVITPETGLAPLGFTSRVPLAPTPVPVSPIEKAHAEERGFRGIFDGFEAKGMRTEISGVTHTGGHELMVEGFVRDTQTGHNVGEFKRRVNFFTGDVEHTHFRLNADHQGKGFATAFVKHSFDGYRSMGLERVKIEAGLTAGGYAWAQMGFSFPGDRTARARAAARLIDWGTNEEVGGLDEFPEKEKPYWRVKNLRARIGNNIPASVTDDDLREFMDKFATGQQLGDAADGVKEVPADKFTEEWQIASYGRDKTWTDEDGRTMWLGKAFMAGADWRGVYDLNQPKALPGILGRHHDPDPITPESLASMLGVELEDSGVYKDRFEAEIASRKLHATLPTTVKLSPEVKKIKTADDAEKYLTTKYGIVAQLHTRNPNADATFYRYIAQAVTDSFERYPTLREGHHGKFAGIKLYSTLSVQGQKNMGERYTSGEIWATTGPDPERSQMRVGDYASDLDIAPLLPPGEKASDFQQGGKDTWIVINDLAADDGFNANTDENGYIASGMAAPSQVTVYGRLMHEMGHAIADTSGIAFLDQANFWGDRLEAAHLSHVDVGVLSGYGAQAPNEAWAEIWASYNTPSVRKRIPKKLGAAFESILVVANAAARQLDPNATIYKPT